MKGTNKPKEAEFYIGKSGKNYSRKEYHNWGEGKTKNNKKDLPIDDYPYKLSEYEPST